MTQQVPLLAGNPRKMAKDLHKGRLQRHSLYATGKTSLGNSVQSLQSKHGGHGWPQNVNRPEPNVVVKWRNGELSAHPALTGSEAPHVLRGLGIGQTLQQPLASLDLGTSPKQKPSSSLVSQLSPSPTWEMSCSSISHRLKPKRMGGPSLPICKCPHTLPHYELPLNSL